MNCFEPILNNNNKHLWKIAGHVSHACLVSDYCYNLFHKWWRVVLWCVNDCFWYNYSVSPDGYDSVYHYNFSVLIHVLLLYSNVIQTLINTPIQQIGMHFWCLQNEIPRVRRNKLEFNIISSLHYLYAWYDRIYYIKYNKAESII